MLLGMYVNVVCVWGGAYVLTYGSFCRLTQIIHLERGNLN